MQLILTPTAEQASIAAARQIAGTLQGLPHPVLGLATGRTMEGIYAVLAQIHQTENLDFSALTSFNLDEYVGLPPADPRSYHHYMQTRLFQSINANPEYLHVPNGTAPNLDAECAAYEAAIRAAGGIDLQLLGIGDTGHIGFNEPPSAFDTRTRVVTLDEATRQQNAAMFGNDPSAVPTHAITMGVGTILDAKHLLLVATGPAKANILAAALEGPITPDVSASAIRLHARCTIIADEASAAALSPELKDQATRIA